MLLPSSPGSIVTSSHHFSVEPLEMCVISAGAPSLNTIITCSGKYNSTCVAVSALRRGEMRKSDCMIAHVDFVTLPVALSRGVAITNFSNAHIACTVFWPNTPSCGPGSNRSAARRCCTRSTSSPFIPVFSVRVSGTVTNGTLVLSTTTSGFDDSVFEPLSPLPTTAIATTVNSTANAAIAGRQRSYALWRKSPYSSCSSRSSGSKSSNSSNSLYGVSSFICL